MLASHGGTALRLDAKLHQTGRLPVRDLEAFTGSQDTSWHLLHEALQHTCIKRSDKQSQQQTCA